MAMDRIKEFVKSTVIGGLLVMLPLAIFVFIASWVFNLVRGAINPLTEILLSRTSLPGVVADVIVVLLIVMACFVVGFVVRTRLGKWLYQTVESKFLKKVPGYSLIKETVSQFLGNKQSPFSSVALVQIYGNDTMVSAFVTDSHDDGTYTVFVPTGPNPTSGNIYHVKGEYVHPVDIPVEDAMRSIISCGAGSSGMIKQLRSK
jgi:uncharacterized membrane protein